MSEPMFYYDVTYDDSFREQVRQGDINPLCELRIVVDGNDLGGAPPEEAYLDEYMFYHFRKVALSIPEILEGESKGLQLYNIPDYLVFSATDEGVYVSLQSPQEFDAADQHASTGKKITKADLVAGVTDGVEEFYSNIIEVDSSLSENENLNELLDILDTIRSTE